MSLEGRMIAISIGDAPDRGRLGYPQREVDRVLLSVCTALVRAGARIVYGGNLDPAGFTFKIFRHLSEAYAVRRPTPPFVHVVPEPVLRRANFADLAAMLKEARGTVETRIAFADERVVKLIAEDDDGPRGGDENNRYAIRAVEPTSPSGTLIDSGEIAGRLARGKPERILPMPILPSDASWCVWSRAVSSWAAGWE